MEKIAAVDIGRTFLGSGHFLTNLSGLGLLGQILLSNAIMIAGIAFTILVIYGGIRMIIGAGSANAEEVAAGRKLIVAAIIGFVVVIAAYWLVKIVGTATGLNLLG